VVRVDIGRRVVEERATEPRPLRERLERTALREGLTRRWLFDPAMKIGKAVRPLLPESLATKVPAQGHELVRQGSHGLLHGRRVSCRRWSLARGVHEP